MSRHLALPFLLLAATLAIPTATARPDEHRRGHESEREDSKLWKEREKQERRYWKQQEGRGHQPHRYAEDGHDRGRRPIPPPWMNGYWRQGESRRYVVGHEKVPTCFKADI